MMKKTIFWIARVLVLSAFGMSLVTASQAQAQDKIVLKLASPWPLGHESTLGSQVLSDLVKKASNGSVEIRVFPSEQLAKAKETHEAVSMGVVDMGVVAGPYIAGRLPIVDIDYMPWLFSSWKSLRDARRGGIDEVIAAELKKAFNLKLLFSQPGGSTELWTVKKPVRNVEDLKGMLIRGAGGALTEGVRAVGATPVTVTGPEVFTALQRGTIDGSMWTLASLRSIKAWEVCKYATRFSRPLGPGVIHVVINQDRWEKLPPNVQKIILEAAPKAQEAVYAHAEKETEEAWAEAAKNGLTIIRPTPEEEAVFAKRMSAVWDWYIGRAGEPGRKLIEIGKKFQ